MKGMKELEERLEKLRQEIKETEKRVPAHSAKPPIMMELIELEDEYDQVYKKIQAIKNES